MGLVWPPASAPRGAWMVLVLVASAAWLVRAQTVDLVTMPDGATVTTVNLVWALNDRNYDSVMSHLTTPLLVYYCRECVLTGEMESMALRTAGVVTVGILEATETHTARKLNLEPSRAPAVLLYSTSEGTALTYVTPANIMGRDAKAIMTEMLPLLAAPPITTVDDTNIEPFLMNNARPKVVLFTERTTPPPLLHMISKKHTAEFDFGMVSSTQKRAQQLFSVKTLPLLVVLKAPSSINTLQFTIFDEMPTATILSKFLTQFLGKPAAGKKVPVGQNKPSARTTAGKDTVAEIVDDATLDYFCYTEGGKPCVVGLFTLHDNDGKVYSHRIPNIDMHYNIPVSDQSRLARPKLLPTLEAVASKHSAQYHFLWLNCDIYSPFISGLGLSPSDLPAAVAIRTNATSTSLSVFDGPFVTLNLNRWLVKLNGDAALFGKTETPPYLHSQRSSLYSLIPPTAYVSRNSP